MTSTIRSELPLELVLQILWLSSLLSSTEHARNVCLVSRAANEHCWPNLWRIVCLRNVGQLKRFAESIHAPSMSDAQTLRQRRKQDAVQAVYLNNNKDSQGMRSLQTREKPEMWMISIMLSARNLQIFHAEEYWSMSYPWEAQDEKPLIAYPLILLSRFATAIEAVLLAAPDTQWAQRLLRSNQKSTAERGDGDIYAAIAELQRTESLRRGARGLVAQPSELTLSALAMSPTHLQKPTDIDSASGEAFDRLTHLHLYFAKLDKRLVDAIAQLPALTHLRLTRPFSELLTRGVETLLALKSDFAVERPALTSLIIEAGIYIDKRTLEDLQVLAREAENKGRLTFLTSSFNQTSHTNLNSSDSNDERSSTGQVLDYVTNSEERGFRDFVARAQGLQGVWQVPM